MNSIYCSNSSANEVIVAKKDGKVRVVLKDNTKVDTIKIRTNAKMEIEKGSIIKKVEVAEAVKEVAIKNEGKIEDFKLKAKEVKINGEKVTKEQEIYVSGSEIKKSEDKVDGKSGALKKENPSSNDSNNNSNDKDDDDSVTGKEDFTDNDVTIIGEAFKESSKNDGSIENTLKLVISTGKNVKFASNLQSRLVDTISSASVSKEAPLPSGLKLEMKRIDDKTLEFKVIGQATKHTENVLTNVRLILKDSMFEGIKDNITGIYATLPIQFHNETEDKESGDKEPGDKELDNQYKIIDTSRTDIIEIESVLYAVVVLKKGNVNDYKFYLDGKSVSM